MEFAFYFAAGIAVMATLRVVTSTNPVHALLYLIISLLAVSMVFFLFALSYLFSEAKITVNPKIQDIILDENLSAHKDGFADSLSFDLVVISGEENKMMQGSGEKEVSKKAEGIVVLYNAFSASSQLLSIDTRLEGSNGKMYKTFTKTVIPGLAKDGKPGSVEVKVFGAEAGADYNSGPLDFEIFGFKNTPKYSKFYGRSKGEITGGFVGMLPVVSENEKVTTT